MKVAIIDADIVGKKKHRFPNLACMKISAYYKSIGATVTLKTDYEDTDDFDKVFISKVFTDTVVPGEPEDKTNKNSETIWEWYKDNLFLHRPNVEFGGTGFYYDKSPPLQEAIEHIMPDYHLYDEWINQCILSGAGPKEFTYYTDYSIGYLTRRCFRGCEFCVNRNYKGVVPASPLSEFMDPLRKKLCFLDDNFFGCPNWKELIQPVIDSGKRFQFKQGLDERLLTVEKIQEMTRWKYDGDMIFAFDNIDDKDLILSKLELIKDVAGDNWKKPMKFYLFCGFDRNGIYDEAFWKKDIEQLFERIELLSRYGAKSYVMRFEKAYASEYAPLYTAVSSWCNQPAIFKTFTFRLFCKCKGMRKDGYRIYKRDVDAYLKDGGFKGKEWQTLERIEQQFPEIAAKYFDFDGKTNRRY